MRKKTDYKPLPIDDLTRLTAQCLPVGLVWDSKGDKESNFYKLLRSLSAEIAAIETKIYEMITEWDINITTSLIGEWEVAVGIPDECRGAAEDIAIRRSDVITKLKNIPVITIADYKALAEVITGKPAAEWNIRPGRDDFPVTSIYRFVLLVTTPTVTSGAFTYPFGSGFESGIGLAFSSPTVTATVSDTTTMVIGGTVVIAGADQSDYNGNHIITAIPNGTSFTYDIVESPVTPATGTITVTFGIDQAQLDAIAANSQFLFDAGTAFGGYPFAGSFRVDILNCVFRKITPANVVVVFD